MTAAPETERAPEIAGLALLRLARRIGIAHKRSTDAKDDYTSVQAAAQLTFAEIRKRGIPNQEIRLPDGSKVATISIEQGGTSTVIDQELLDAVAAGNDPRDFEDYVEVRAYSDPKVIALIAEHMPDLVSRRLKPYVLAQYKQEIDENAGHVVDRTTGERVQVTEITRHAPSGKFAVRFTSKGRIALQDALDSGVINEFGESDADEPGVADATEAALAETAEEDRARLTGNTGGSPDLDPDAVLEDGDPPAGDGLYTNADGGFISPEAAAAHAINVQGGFSTPAREARRMVRDGGASGEMAQAWLDERGLSVDGDDEPAAGGERE